MIGPKAVRYMEAADIFEQSARHHRVMDRDPAQVLKLRAGIQEFKRMLETRNTLLARQRPLRVA